MELLRPTSAAEAVAQGAQLLDERYPGWWRDINLDILWLASCSRCVCGQLAAIHLQRDAFETNGGVYMRFVRGLGGDDFITGFNTASSPLITYARYLETDSEWDFAALEEEWRQVITARLEADTKNGVESGDGGERPGTIRAELDSGTGGRQGDADVAHDHRPGCLV